MRKMIVLAFAALWMMPAFAADLATGTMDVTIEVGQYATIHDIGSLSVVISEPGTETATSLFMVDANCDVTATVGTTPAEKVTGTALSKQYTRGATSDELQWDVKVVGGATDYTQAIPKGSVGASVAVELTATTGADWQAAWADTYEGAVTLTVSTP